MAKFKAAGPAFGDRVVVVVMTGNGPRIKFFAYFCAAGYGSRGTGRRRQTCDEEFMYEHQEPFAHEDYCILMVPYYEPRDGGLYWRRYSCEAGKVQFDCASIRMMDEHTRNLERGREWEQHQSYIGSNVEQRVIRSIIHSVFPEENCRYHSPTEEDLAAFLVACGAVQPVDFAAEGAAQVKDALRKFNAEKETSGPVDF